MTPNGTGRKGTARQMTQEDLATRTSPGLAVPSTIEFWFDTF